MMGTDTIAAGKSAIFQCQSNVANGSVHFPVLTALRVGAIH
jgi:hypothetical protein